jgi:hypothetical protein
MSAIAAGPHAVSVAMSTTREPAALRPTTATAGKLLSLAPACTRAYSLHSGPPPASRQEEDESRNEGSNLFVTGIHPSLTEEEVTRLFQKYGEVEQCNIMRDPHTKESRGFGFVKMVTSDQADAAKEGLQGEVHQGRTLSIEKARRAKPRTPTPGKYYGPPKRGKFHVSSHCCKTLTQSQSLVVAVVVVLPVAAVAPDMVTATQTTVVEAMVVATTMAHAAHVTMTVVTEVVVVAAAVAVADTALRDVTTTARVASTVMPLTVATVVAGMAVAGTADVRSVVAAEVVGAVTTTVLPLPLPALVATTAHPLLVRRTAEEAARTRVTTTVLTANSPLTLSEPKRY